MTRKLAIIHGQSVNQGEKRKSLSLDTQLDPLTWPGEAHSKLLGITLREVYNIDPPVTPAAVSTLYRTKQTALLAGFKEVNLIEYSILDEIPYEVSYERLVINILRGIFPAGSHEAARKVLETPPFEDILFIHTALAAAIYSELGLNINSEDLKSCRVKELALKVPPTEYYL